MFMITFIAIIPPERDLKVFPKGANLFIDFITSLFLQMDNKTLENS